MFQWFGRFPGLLVIVVLVFLFLAGDGYRIIQYPPRSTHIFRQSDCLAYTKAYLQNSSSFFSPATFNLAGKEGRVVSEFPILYFISAKLCVLFGFHFWILRGVTFLCYFVGLFYLFRIARFWIKSPVLALFSVVILASSPYYFFYGVNYLPNVPAISFSFCGLYYFLRYRQSGSISYVLPATVFFILATLLKPTDGGLIWLAYVSVLVYEHFANKKAGRHLTPMLFSSAVIGFFVVIWYLFVRNYNATNGNTVNLQGFYPIWDMPSEDIVRTLKFRIIDLGPHCFHHSALLFLLVGFLIVYVVRWKMMDPFLRSFTLMLIVGSIFYAPLWYKAFFIHDYYQLIFAIPAVFLSITVVAFLQEHVMPRLSTRGKSLLGFGMTGVMIAAIYYNQSIQIINYGDDNVGFNNIREIYESEPYLRKMGISVHDKVLSLPDGSPNITLAAFGNPGIATDVRGDAGIVPYCKAMGVKYMIISDSSYTHDPAFEPYTHKVVGKYKGICLYDLR